MVLAMVALQRLLRLVSRAVLAHSLTASTVAEAAAVRAPRTA